MKLVPVQIAIAALATVCACSAAPNAETTASSSEAIIDGTPVASDTLGSAMLWYCPNGTSGCTFTAGSATRGCSGTMVADRWFLTAQHCVSTDESYSGGTAVNASDLLVWSADGSTSATGVQVVLHPTLDVALVQLSGPIESGGYDMCTPVWTGATASLVGTNVYCQGFGINNVAQQSGYGTLRSAIMTVAEADPEGMLLFMNSQGQALAPGDSGTGCFLYSPGAGSPNAVVATMSVESSGPTVPPAYDELVSADGIQSWVTSTITTTNCGGYWKCGSLTDACGQTVNCGTCGGSTPYCYSGTCYSCPPRECPFSEYWDATTCACVGCPCGLVKVSGHWECAVGCK
jgi:hypothetical protein